MNIVTRDEWDARPPRHAYHRIARFQRLLILHHAGGALLPGDDRVSNADLRRIGGIQDFHLDDRGWNDIAYSYLTDPDGFAFEGRGPEVANGATKGYGASSYAICVMGHYDRQPVDDDLVDGIVELVRWGHGEGLWPLAISGGHRDYGSTSCPGDNLYPLIPEINRLLREPEEDTMSPEQEAKLDKVLQLLEAVPNDTYLQVARRRIEDPFHGDSPQFFTFIRRIYLSARQGYRNSAQSLKILEKLAKNSGLSDETIARIADEAGEAVADELGERLGG